MSNHYQTSFITSQGIVSFSKICRYYYNTENRSFTKKQIEQRKRNRAIWGKNSVTSVPWREAKKWSLSCLCGKDNLNAHPAPREEPPPWLCADAAGDPGLFVCVQTAGQMSWHPLNRCTMIQLNTCHSKHIIACRGTRTWKKEGKN